MNIVMKTYTTTRSGFLPFFREAFQLYQLKTFDVAGQAKGTANYMRGVEQTVMELTGVTIEAKQVLNIGCGQVPREVICLGIKNHVTAIDLDVIPQGFDPNAYFKMLQQNGAMRTLKTIARKSMGIDRKFIKALKTELGTTKSPKAAFLQMNAEQMKFEGDHFDFIYSFSVFEHLPNPGKVIDEAIRVMKPGAVCYISLHLYSSEGGCHDMRIFANQRDMIPYWAQLRPQHKDLVVPNAYMNEMRLDAWRKMFEEKMPGCTFKYNTQDPEHHELLKKEIAKIRAQGELADYSDEELLTMNVIAVWKKPGAMM